MHEKDHGVDDVSGGWRSCQCPLPRRRCQCRAGPPRPRRVVNCCPTAFSCPAGPEHTARSNIVLAGHGPQRRHPTSPHACRCSHAPRLCHRASRRRRRRHGSAQRSHIRRSHPPIALRDLLLSARCHQRSKSRRRCSGRYSANSLLSRVALLPTGLAAPADNWRSLP